MTVATGTYRSLASRSTDGSSLEAVARMTTRSPGCPLCRRAPSDSFHLRQVVVPTVSGHPPASFGSTRPHAMPLTGSYGRPRSPRRYAR